jgi:predicted ferric reductase
MVTQSKVSTQSDLNFLVDTVLVGFGIVFGGMVVLISLWLWFDYQADPVQSFLAILSARFINIFPVSLRSYFGYEAQLMGLPLTGQTPAFWYMARSGGIVAYLLLWLSTVWGLTLSTKITAGLVSAPMAYGLHEFFSIGAILFSVLHSMVLLGDEYIKFNIFHLLIPFSAPYEPLGTGLGILGLYLSAAMTGSFYIRKKIGQKRWRVLHYLTFVTYLLVLGHSLMAGTDSSLAIIKLMYLVTGFSVLFLAYYRLFTLKVDEKRSARSVRK